MAWMTTEAYRTRSPHLRLGRSLSEFLDEIGVKSSDSGGESGVRNRVANQLRRLLACNIDLQYKGDDGVERGTTTNLVKDRCLWWDAKKPKQGSLFDSYIRLSTDFFNEIMANPVPIDMKVLRARKRSSLGIDLYLWAAYRTKHIREPKKVPWKRLHEQFGPGPGDRPGRARGEDVPGSGGRRAGEAAARMAGAQLPPDPGSGDSSSRRCREYRRSPAAETARGTKTPR